MRILTITTFLATITLVASLSLGSPEETKAAMTAMDSRLNKAASKALSVFAQLHTREGDDGSEPDLSGQSEACQSAFERGMALAEDPTCSVLFNDEVDIFESPEDQQIEILTGFCPTCKQPFIDIFRELFAECTFPDANAAEEMKFIPHMLDLVCTQHAGEFCIAKVGALDDAPDPLTETFLDSVCNPCVKIVLTKLSAVMPDMLNVGLYVDVACTKYKETYCFLELQRVMAMSDDLAKVEASCATRCIPKILNKVRNLGGDVDNFGGMLGFNVMCNKNPEDELCITKVFNLLEENQLEAKCDNETSGEICADGGECETAVQTLFNDGGCCATNWIYITADGALEDREAQIESMRDILETHCDVTVPALCPGLVKVIKAYTFYNVICPWYEEHKSEVDLALREDMAANAGVELDMVTIAVTCEDLAGADGRRLLQAGDGKLNVQVEVEAENDDFAADIQADLDSPLALKNTNAQMAEGGSGPLPVGEEPPPGEETSTTSPCCDEESSACLNAVSAFAVVAGLILAF